jgi:N-acetylneuraminate lyase
MSYEHWKGIIPAMLTPYGDDGAIHEERTRRLARHLLDQGVAGLYLLGSTGEGFLLTPDERKQVLEIVLDEVKGQVPVIVHVGTMDTATTVELTRHAARAGADAVSAVAPFYYKHRPQEIRNHYLDIVRAADIPLIIYHFPDYTGVSATASFYGELAKVDQIIGLKYTSKDTFELQQIIDVCGDDFLVYNGPDECLLAGLATGCCGAIGSTYNIMPRVFIELLQAFREGRWEEARSKQAAANRVIAELLKYDFIAFEREILRLQGIPVGAPRKPIQQLTPEQRESIRAFAEQHPILGIGQGRAPA